MFYILMGLPSVYFVKPMKLCLYNCAFYYLRLTPRFKKMEIKSTLHFSEIMMGSRTKHTGPSTLSFRIHKPLQCRTQLEECTALRKHDIFWA